MIYGTWINENENENSCSIYTICAKCNIILPVIYILYFYISTSCSMCVVPSIIVFCSSLILCFPGMLLRYCLSDFEMVPVAPIVTSITFAFTFHMHWISIIIIIIVIIVIVVIVLLLLLLFSLVTDLFLALLLNQWWFPPIRLQVSGCSTLHIMCDVPTILSFVGNLLNVFLVFFNIFSESIYYYSIGSSYFWYNLTFQVPHSLYL